MCNTSTKKEKSSSQATMGSQEQELYGMGLSSYNANAGGEGMSLIDSILGGSSNLPGFWGNMGEGISEDMITDMSQKAIRDLLPSFQQSGILDSGVAASISGRTAGDIRRGSAQFNIANKHNLLNLALSGKTNLTNSMTNQYSILAQQLAGLRKIKTKGKSSYTPSPLQTAFAGMQGIGSLASGIGGMATGFGWGNTATTV